MHSGNIAGPYNFREHFSSLTFGNLSKAALLMAETSAPVSILKVKGTLFTEVSASHWVVCWVVIAPKKRSSYMSSSLIIVGYSACGTESADFLETHATVCPLLPHL